MLMPKIVYGQTRNYNLEHYTSSQEKKVTCSRLNLLLCSDAMMKDGTLLVPFPLVVPL